MDLGQLIQVQTCSVVSAVDVCALQALLSGVLAGQQAQAQQLQAQAQEIDALKAQAQRQQHAREQDAKQHADDDARATHALEVRSALHAEVVACWLQHWRR